MTVHRISFLVVLGATALIGACDRAETPTTRISITADPISIKEQPSQPQLDVVATESPVPVEPSTKVEPAAQTEPAAQAEPAAQVEPAAPSSTPQPQSVVTSPQDSVPASTVVERKSSVTARSKGEINFDDLKFELAKDAPFNSDLLTSDIRQLEGTKVKLRGYILPSTLFSETNISQFVLVRDNQECCFGPGAALFDCVMVQMVEGKTTDFVTRPVTVEGRFVIDTESYRYPPGYSPVGGATHMAVFRIEGVSVQ